MIVFVEHVDRLTLETPTLVGCTFVCLSNQWWHHRQREREKMTEKNHNHQKMSMVQTIFCNIHNTDTRHMFVHVMYLQAIKRHSYILISHSLLRTECVRQDVVFIYTHDVFTGNKKNTLIPSSILRTESVGQEVSNFKLCFGWGTRGLFHP